MSKKFEKLADDLNINYKDEEEITGSKKEEILKKKDLGEELDKDIIVKNIAVLVTDPEKIKEYKSLKESELPKGIRKSLESGNVKFYEENGDRKAYKQNALTDDEFKTAIEGKKANHLASVANSLKLIAAFTAIIMVILALMLITIWAYL